MSEAEDMFLEYLQLLEKYKAVDLDEYQRVKTELAAVQV